MKRTAIASSLPSPEELRVMSKAKLAPYLPILLESAKNVGGSGGMKLIPGERDYQRENNKQQVHGLALSHGCTPEHIMALLENPNCPSQFLDALVKYCEDDTMVKMALGHPHCADETLRVPFNKTEAKTSSFFTHDEKLVALHNPNLGEDVLTRGLKYVHDNASQGGFTDESVLKLCEAAMNNPKFAETMLLEASEWKADVGKMKNRNVVDNVEGFMNTMSAKAVSSAIQNKRPVANQVCDNFALRSPESYASIQDINDWQSLIQQALQKLSKNSKACTSEEIRQWAPVFAGRWPQDLVFSNPNCPPDVMAKVLEGWMAGRADDKELVSRVGEQICDMIRNGAFDDKFLARLSQMESKADKPFEKKIAQAAFGNMRGNLQERLLEAIEKHFVSEEHTPLINELLDKFFGSSEYSRAQKEQVFEVIIGKSQQVNPYLMKALGHLAGIGGRIYDMVWGYFWSHRLALEGDLLGNFVNWLTTSPPTRLQYTVEFYQWLQKQGLLNRANPLFVQKFKPHGRGNQAPQIYAGMSV